ncbi:hypothetical protein R1sor_006940 [Riccia sorocarpa]|uniref:Uncharacterized protein n=1 Tax=Riccia sorocarpa TaxID=122646 RepID=A0ABD3HVA6_9MARC
MAARESAFSSLPNTDVAAGTHHVPHFSDSVMNDEFSQRPDFGSQGSFLGISTHLLSVPSSQVHPQLQSRVVRPRVTPVDPQQLAAWARQAGTQQLPASPPEITECSNRFPVMNLVPGVFPGADFRPLPSTSAGGPSSLPGAPVPASTPAAAPAPAPTSAAAMNEVPGVSQLRPGDTGHEVRSALAEYLALAT